MLEARVRRLEAALGEAQIPLPPLRRPTQVPLGPVRLRTADDVHVVTRDRRLVMQLERQVTAATAMGVPRPPAPDTPTTANGPAPNSPASPGNSTPPDGPPTNAA
jgi:hypothetical protein